MKFVKILSAILAVIAVMAMFAACTPAGPGEETPPVDDVPAETKPRHQVKAHFKVLDHNGKEVYSTDEDEPYEYDSANYEPTVLTFIEDYAFMNYKKFAYKLNSNNLIDSVSITSKKKTTTYKAGEVVISKLDGSEQKTFWVCLINGKEIASMEETIVQEGDTVVLRLAYYGSDKVVETKPDYTVPAETDEPAAE
jgi:hypothetical protein